MEQKIEIETCKECNGKNVINGKKCDNCNGKGVIKIIKQQAIVKEKYIKR